MDHQKKIDDLVKLYREASEAYYTGEPIMPDSSFDRIQNILRELDPDHPVLKDIGADVHSNHLTKTAHLISMNSLSKVNTKEELKKWAEKIGGKVFAVTEKFDGLSIELVYEEGKFKQAITRGNGVIGENVTSNIRHAQWVYPIVTGFSGSLRGEVIISKTDFENHFKDDGYSNPRNAAAGFTRRKKRDQRLKYLQVKYFDCCCTNTKEDFKTKEQQLIFMKSLGLKMPPYKVVSIEEIFKLYDFYQETRRDSLNYEIDGLVCECNDLKIQDRLGVTDNRPKGMIAFKFPSKAKSTILRDVVWEVGKTGRLTPVGHFDKVHIGGVDIRKASLHNYANIQNLGLFIGCKILVSRRGDTIPYIEGKIDA
ncbi:MAG TPA: hypothetical protein VMX17_15780 [Candidatus Glassbacteria bacterium]|nr:hypothetical protein [Candidatus Glassbacteria bacterium]